MIVPVDELIDYKGNRYELQRVENEVGAGHCTVDVDLHHGPMYEQLKNNPKIL